MGGRGRSWPHCWFTASNMYGSDSADISALALRASYPWHDDRSFSPHGPPTLATRMLLLNPMVGNTGKNDNTNDSSLLPPPTPTHPSSLLIWFAPCLGSRRNGEDCTPRWPRCRAWKRRHSSREPSTSRTSAAKAELVHTPLPLRLQCCRETRAEGMEELDQRKTERNPKPTETKPMIIPIRYEPPAAK